MIWSTMPHLAMWILFGVLLGCDPQPTSSTKTPDTKPAHKAHEGHEEHGHHEEESEGDAHKGHGDEAHAPKEVKLSQKAMTRSKLKLAQAVVGTLDGGFEIPAEIALNPDRVAHISAVVKGQLLSVEVALGDKVKAKEVLGRLRSVELGQARAELRRTTAMRDVADQTRARQLRLRKEGINAQRNVLEAESTYRQASAERDAAKSRLRVLGAQGSRGSDMTLKSPMDGIIVERHATRGENVSPENTLFVVADLSRVWVMGSVYEQHVAQVSKGMTAALTLEAYPGRSWRGTVDFVGSTIDHATRTLPIRVELDNPEGVLRPGLFGALRLMASTPNNPTVLIPRSAVQTMDGERVVFVQGNEIGEFEAREVVVGREGADQVEVLKGLSPKEFYVKQGAFILKSELMRGQLGHGHAH